MNVSYVLNFLAIYQFFSLTLNKYALFIEELLPDHVVDSLWCFFLLRALLVFSTVGVAFVMPFFASNIGLSKELNWPRPKVGKPAIVRTVDQIWPLWTVLCFAGLVLPRWIRTEFSSSNLVLWSTLLAGLMIWYGHDTSLIICGVKGESSAKIF
ncbi:vacuolar amino acid transporter 1 [Gossypium australe]|uniref:Vacuolar amino acid transporter 1 n=1 Tax=Gossypium australe TaxID=47621 RepID=A0A5B6UKW0_9ROSI|nr:vacuolar amino acid transporter 1 [Gossypium australe]